MTAGPIAQFKEWLAEAGQHPDIVDATAMCLATADTHGQPSARIVLLKHVDDRGFVFYTNLESHKSNEIKHNPKVALCLYWPPLGKQVRIEGDIALVSNKEADAYFATRPRESQIGAWASKQSQPLSSRDQLARTVAEVTAKFTGKDIPRPDFWSGWRIIPRMIEFWQQGEFRLHEREMFTRTSQGWTVNRLYP